MTGGTGRPPSLSRLNPPRQSRYPESTMKTIGLIGGVSWHSTTLYYRTLNQRVHDRLGGLASAKVLLLSVNFAEVAPHQFAPGETRHIDILADAARRLDAAGADMLLLCSNTLHEHIDTLQRGVRAPFLHIADAAGRLLTERGHRRVGLVGTRITMEAPFYADRLRTGFDLDVRTPQPGAFPAMDQLIFCELAQGQFGDPQRAQMTAMVDQLAAAGADCVLLACTELGLVTDFDHAPIPIYDSAILHAEAAVADALADVQVEA